MTARISKRRQNACNCVSYAGAFVALAALDVSFKGQCILRNYYFARPFARMR